MTETVKDVLRALDNDLQTSVLAFSASGFGTAALRTTLDGIDPDEVLTLHVDTWRHDEPPLLSMNRAKIMAALALNGPIEQRLGTQWLVSFYALWDEEYRPRLAAAHGVAPDLVRADLLGDLRLLRNDVVHHREVASTGNTGRCKLLGHWFRIGDRMILKNAHVEEFVQRFPWEKLRVAPAVSL